MSIQYHDVIRRPLVSEKLSRLQGEGRDMTICGAGEWFAFEVDRKASKPEIKQAVEEMYASLKISVTKVRTINARGRAGRFGRVGGSVSYWKKALVQLAAGQTLSAS